MKPTRRIRASKEEAKWHVEEKWAPLRRLSTPELGAARRMFFTLDKDGSGSIDAEELGQAMRQLGQNPTEKELQELIKSVDEGDCDGKIQLREFLNLYTRGLDTQSKTGISDLNDVFSALGGDARNPDAKVSTEHLHEVLLAEYGLDVRACRACLRRPSTTAVHGCPRPSMAVRRVSRASACQPPSRPRHASQVDLGETFGVRRSELSVDDFGGLILVR